MDDTHDNTHGSTHDSAHGSAHGSTEAGAQEGADRAHRAGAFDIRVFIGALLGLYGLVLLLTSVFGTTQEELDRAGGVDVNLWTGLGLLLAAAAFVAWARLRPVVVPADGAGEEPPAR